MKKILFSLFCVLLSLNCSLSFADAIYLKNGKVILGTVKEKGSYYVVFVENGVEHKYYESEIKKVEEDNKPSVLPPINEAVNNIPQEKKDLINKLLEVNGSRKALESTLKNIVSKAPKDKKAEISNIFNINNILDHVIPLYDKYFSVEELTAIVAFYESKPGQKIIQETPKIMQGTMQFLIDLAKEQSTQ